METHGAESCEAISPEEAVRLRARLLAFYASRTMAPQLLIGSPEKWFSTSCTCFSNSLYTLSLMFVQGWHREGASVVSFLLVSLVSSFLVSLAFFKWYVRKTDEMQSSVSSA